MITDARHIDGLGVRILYVNHALTEMTGFLYQRFHHNADSKGIGLYLVHSQITALGGSIEVITFVDKGSVFVLTFKQACNTEYPINN